MSVHGGRGKRERIRGLAIAAAGAGLALVLAACSSSGDINASDTKPLPGASPSHSGGAAGDPGCTDALRAISEHGPSAVELMAKGRGALRKAAVQVLVDGLDAAADAAGSPQTKQTIQKVADDYNAFFRLTDDATTIPLTTLLKDSTTLEFICR